MNDIKHMANTKIAKTEAKSAETGPCRCSEDTKDMYHILHLDMSDWDHELDSLDIFFCTNCCLTWGEP